MTDEIMDDFGMTANDYSIVDLLNDFYERCIQNMELQEARRRDPNWQLEPIHIAPKHVYDIMEDSETPPEIKNALLISTYAGEQWVRVDDEDIPVPSP